MNKLLPIITVFLLFNAVAFAYAETTFFTNVNVIPMTTDTVLKNQTVIVEGDRISAIHSTDKIIEVPAGAEVIDGKDNYLVPGLTDMHTHISQTDRNPEHVVLYPAFGVTTVRALNGSPADRVVKQMVESGEIVGPDMIIGGLGLYGNYGDDFDMEAPVKIFHTILLLAPLTLLGVGFFLINFFRRNKQKKNTSVNFIWVKCISSIAVATMLGVFLSNPNIVPFNILSEPLYGINFGYLVETDEQAIKEVQRQKSEGDAFIKPYDGLTLEQYVTANQEAERLDMYSVGHAPNQVPLQIIVTSGQDEIAHIDELLSYHWKGYNLSITSNPDSSENNGQYPLDYEAIAHTIKLLKENNISIVANIVLSEIAFNFILDAKRELEKPEYRLIKESVRNEWLTSSKWVKGAFSTQGEYRKNKAHPFLMELLNQLNKAGIIITTGTDASVEGVIPGFHIHRELEILVESGMTPYQALKASTVNAAKVIGYMGVDNNFGTVEVGQKANLILVTKNPLKNISHTRERVGVMINGKWHTQTELDELVDKLTKNN